MRTLFSGVHMLSLNGMANVYLITTGDGLVLVDAGSGRHAKGILRSISMLSEKAGPLRHLVITHGHSDHIGGAAAIAAHTGAQIWMHPADAKALTSGQGNSAVAPAGSWLAGRLVPGRVKPAPVDGELEHDQVLPFAPDWRVVHLPGHTLGSCCLYQAANGILIMGDSVMRWFGRLTLPFRMVTVDSERNRRGLRELCQLGFEAALLGHGPPIMSDAHLAISRLIQANPDA